MDWAPPLITLLRPAMFLRYPGSQRQPPRIDSDDNARDPVSRALVRVGIARESLTMPTSPAFHPPTLYVPTRQLEDMTPIPRGT